MDAPSGYRKGYGKPPKVTTRPRTITIRRQRMRNLEERFESRILPLVARRSQEVSELLPEQYLHGFAERDFDKRYPVRWDMASVSGQSARTPPAHASRTAGYRSRPPHRSPIWRNQAK